MKLYKPPQNPAHLDIVTFSFYSSLEAFAYEPSLTVAPTGSFCKQQTSQQPPKTQNA